VHVVSLHVYPVKGTRGISLDRADVLFTGIRHDRRFMVLDEDGTFLTQRTHPKLALVETAITGDTLTLDGTVEVLLDDTVYRDRPRLRVKVWDDFVDAVEAPGDASLFFSDRLGEPCTLVRFPDDSVRPVEQPHGRDADRVAFADAYPLLVASTSSLADLNARLDVPVPMNRFRPSIVVDGAPAFEEEKHEAMTIGALHLRTPKRCARCAVTVVDQATAEAGKEPLRTLASYRTENHKVYFAMNAIPDAEGVISLGDRVVW
jgi:uncharacterized protein YcbX